MTNKNCVYCGKEITNPSREHVIHNALGGKLESTDICCPECNHYISREIDVPFVKIFNPILGNIKDLQKTNHSKSKPHYTGKVRYLEETYPAKFSGGRLVSCTELSKKYHCNPANLPVEIVEYDFNIDNEQFKNGIQKIVFNYAIASGVNPDLIKHGLKIQQNDGQQPKISFDYPMQSFFPVNSLDYFLELATPMTLYHNMILFSETNLLWCYIDLFNTFQFYIQLSDNLPKNTNIYNSYMQTIQKNDTTIPKIEINSEKEAALYAKYYGVEPCMDATEMTKRIKTALEKQPYIQPMEKIIEQKLDYLDVADAQNGKYDFSNKTPILISLPFYFNGNDTLKPHKFRMETPYIIPNTVLSYPGINNALLRKDKDAFAPYAIAKMLRLSQYLLPKTK